MKTINRFSKFNIRLLFPLFVVIAAGCNKTEEFSIDYKSEYFPVETGHYIIYDVDSFTFNPFLTDPYDTFRYQKKEVIDSAFTDNSGREAFQLKRYQRKDETEPWKLTDVWHLVKTAKSAEKVEENQRFLKLLFPPEEGMSWNGNRYINITDENWYLDGWNYTISELDVSETLNNLHFDSVLTVLQHDDENAIKKVYAMEKYAKNVGLIYKELWALEKYPAASWMEPDEGFIVKMTISGWGKE